MVSVEVKYHVYLLIIVVVVDAAAAAVADAAVVVIIIIISLFIIKKYLTCGKSTNGTVSMTYKIQDNFNNPLRKLHCLP